MDIKNLSLQDIRARRKQIAEEDRMLADVEANLVKLAALYSHYPQAVAANIRHPERVKPSLISQAGQKRPQKTKNELIIQALNAPRPLWQAASQIRTYLSNESGKDVPMTSISPALTLLKKSGTIVRNDLLVALALRVETEEPDFFNENGEAEASPETAAEVSASADMT